MQSMASALHPPTPHHYTTNKELSFHTLSPKVTVFSSAPIPPKEAKMAVYAQASVLSQVVEDSDFLCNFCKAKGWLICDFCNGQKINVQVKNNRIYRRCPSCKAAGVVLCPNCKVYKCITFPDGKDGGI